MWWCVRAYSCLSHRRAQRIQHLAPPILVEDSSEEEESAVVVSDEDDTWERAFSSVAD